MTLANKKALLTGATGGLGHAIARELSKRGVSLTLTGRRTEVLEPLAKELNATALACDLSQADEVAKLAESAGDVDLFICNAALPASGPLSSFSVAELDRALAVNLRAPMVLSRLIGERMAERGGGHIVFISSLAGKVSSGNGSVYSATKFGLRGFSFGLREDLQHNGIGVSCVSPGFIREAGMFHESGAKLPSVIGTSTPEDVAQAVVKAIDHNRSEIVVAPTLVRASSFAMSLAPGVASTVQRKFRGDQVAEQIAKGQTDKR